MYTKYCCEHCNEEFQYELQCIEHEKTCTMFMSSKETSRLVELLQKWRSDDLTWGECNELREFKYRFSDAIDRYWQDSKWLEE